MNYRRGLATVAYLKARFDAGADHLSMFQPFVEEAIHAAPGDDIELANVQTAVRQAAGLYIPEDIVKTLLRRAARSGFLTRRGGRFLRTQRLGTVSAFGSQIAKLEVANQQLAARLREYAEARGRAFDSDDDALATLTRFLDTHHIGVVLGQPVRVAAPDGTNRSGHVVAAFVAETITAQGPDAAIVDGIVKGLIVQNALLLRDVPITGRHFAGLTVFVDSGVLLQALGYAGAAEMQATTEALSLIRAAGARLGVFAGTVSEMESILRVYQDKLGSSRGIKSLRATPLTHHFLNVRATPGQIRQEIALLTTNLNRLGARVREFPEHTHDYTEDEQTLANALRDHNRHPDADEARVWHDVMAVAAIVTLRAGDRPSGVATAKYVFASGSLRTVNSATRWYRKTYSHGVEPIVHFRSVTNAAWFLRPTDASDVPIHALVGVCAAVLQPAPDVWSRFVEHLNELVTAGELSDDESIAVVASEFTRIELADVEPDADVEATTVREIVQRVRSEEQSQFAEVLREERRKRDRSERDAISARYEAASVKTAVRARAGRLAAFASNATFGLLFFLLTAGAVLTLPTRWSEATRGHQVGSVLWWLCVAVFVVGSLLGLTRKLHALVSRPTIAFM